MFRLRTNKQRIVIIMTALFLIGCSAILNKKADNINPNDFISSGKNDVYPSEGYSSYDEYLSRTSQLIQKYLVPITNESRAKEIRFATPYQLTPKGECNSNESKGILLVHGLGDTPIIMDSLAKYFQQECFLVRVLLLPGHGTRPADLIKVSRKDWVASVDFGLETLRKEVKDIYVGGFSLGGLLAINAGLKNPDIKGVFSFSAPLKTGYHYLISQTTWLRYIVDWLDKDPREDPGRYDSMTMNGTAETTLLAKEVSVALNKKPLQIPVFFVQSADDRVIDVTHNKSVFQHSMLAKESQLIVYRRNATNTNKNKPLVEINSYLPNEKIYSFPHRSLHVAPDHPHYGEKSEWRDCGKTAGDIPKEMVIECENALNPWRGERVGIDKSVMTELGAFARLSYNPKWEQIKELMTKFTIATR